MTSGLHTSVVGDGERTVFVLHGILGSGRNWRSICRALATRRPEFRFVLVDLRNHGESSPAAPPHTLESCAQDLIGLGSPEVVIGHSFGGKVALTLAKSQPPDLDRVVVLDAEPGRVEGAAGAGVLSVISALRRVALPAQSRDSVRAALASHGLSAPIVAWLATSLRRTTDGWTWKYDLDAVDAMIADYFETNLWPWLSKGRNGPKIDLVRALQSDSWTASALAQFDRLPPASRVRLHELENAGHWLHIDNPAGLVELVVRIVESD